MKIITEEMRFRQRLCEYALKYGVTKAARKYQTNRQFVYRQLKKYDGALHSDHESRNTVRMLIRRRS